MTYRSFFIADFYFKRGDGSMLVVEVDGSSHRGREKYDSDRTDWIVKHKKAVLIRFKNEEVLSDVDSVVRAILQYRPIYFKGCLGMETAEKVRQTV